MTRFVIMLISGGALAMAYGRVALVTEHIGLVQNMDPVMARMTAGVLWS